VNKFQIDSNQIKQVASLFSATADLLDSTSHDLFGASELLRGTWSGKAAEAYFNEMDSQIIPFLKQLTQAFHVSSDKVRNMADHAEDLEYQIINELKA